MLRNFRYNNKYYDPSYGLSSTRSFVKNDELLKDYSIKALSGVVYAKRTSNPKINAIKYKPKTFRYLNPFDNYTLSFIDKNKFRYKTVRASMEKELLTQLYIT